MGRRKKVGRLVFVSVSVCVCVCVFKHFKQTAKLVGYMYATPVYMYLWLPFLWGAGCMRQGRKSLFERGPPVLGNFELSTPNLLH